MRLICWLWTIVETLRTWTPGPMGWVPVSGHLYAEQPDGSLRCERCGRQEATDAP